MITLLLWTELLIETSACVLLAALLTDHNHRFMLVCLPLLVFVTLRVVMMLIVSVLLWCLRDRNAPSLSMGGHVRLIGREALALVHMYFLMLIDVGNIKLPPPSSRETPCIVVLLHGVYCNRGIWRPWLRWLRARTTLTFVVPNLVPVMGSLDVQADRFARWFNDATRTQSPPNIILVGFSMGGLIARICVEHTLLNASVHKLICIGTPHAGSRVANYALGDVGRDLRINSIALSQLKSMTTGDAMQLINLYSRHDTFVVPCQNAYLPGAINDDFDGVGHLGLLYSPDVRARVLRELLTS